MNPRQNMRNQLENRFCAVNNNVDYDRMIRLKKTLENRLNLLNLFMPLINKNHKKYTISNIGIDVNNENQINQFMKKSGNQISMNYEVFKDFFLKNGTKWHIMRLTESF